MEEAARALAEAHNLAALLQRLAAELQALGKAELAAVGRELHQLVGGGGAADGGAQVWRRPQHAGQQWPPLHAGPAVPNAGLHVLPRRRPLLRGLSCEHLQTGLGRRSWPPSRLDQARTNPYMSSWTALPAARSRRDLCSLAAVLPAARWVVCTGAVLPVNAQSSALASARLPSHPSALADTEGGG